MLFQGSCLRLQDLGDGIAELTFDRQGDVINKFDQATISELRQATGTIATTPTIRGVLVTSAKSVFIVGADITEFGEMFTRPPADIEANGARSNEVFNLFEDLSIPSVVAVNGFALGGGLEFVLANALRVMSSDAQIGLPEVNLGLFPGLGGTVRLPRVAGVQTAADWIVSGKPANAQKALASGAVDQVAVPEELRNAAIALLRDAINGKVDWRAHQQRKLVAINAPAGETEGIFSAAKAAISKTGAKHQPAAMAAVESMERSAKMDRNAALTEEGREFARVAKTQAANSLVQTFLSDQLLKKLFKQHAKNAQPVKQGAVLGAGIMGGGIAFTSVQRGTPVLLKDIAQSQLDLGIQEARKQLDKQVRNGRIDQARADRTLSTIHPQLDYAAFDKADVVIEAVVENIQIKHRVLSELETVVRADTMIASNTSSLRIDDIAMPLKRPENFVGMHFFNPVPVMKLVEIIKGSKTSERAVSTAVSYAVAMGKTPIVVKDCPGFLVNRVLTAYVRAYMKLIVDGADFERADRVMEAFGWPMGPAYLQDVVGMDTGSHVSDLIAAGYPERMLPLPLDPLKLMVENKRFGQKNGLGFYRYETDPAGKPKRSVPEDTRVLLAAVQPNGRHEFTDQEVIERTMLPMIIEAAHVLEDGVVATAAELDQALLLGIGFPAYMGGALKYADWLGLAQVCERAKHYNHLGAAYEPTKRMLEMAAMGQKYYG